MIELKFGSKAALAFRVEKLEPARQVVWSAVQVPPDWKGTRLTFDIAPAENAANLRFSQSGFVPNYALFSRFSYLWAQYMRSIKLLLETGEGEPYGSPGSKATGPAPR